MTNNLLNERWSFAQFLCSLRMQNRVNLSSSEIVKHKLCPIAEVTALALLKESVLRGFVDKTGTTRNTRYTVNGKLLDIQTIDDFKKIISVPVSKRSKEKKQIPSLDLSDPLQSMSAFVDDYKTIKKRNEALEKSNSILLARNKEYQKTIEMLYKTLLPYLNQAK